MCQVFRNVFFVFMMISYSTEKHLQKGLHLMALKMSRDDELKSTFLS